MGAFISADTTASTSATSSTGKSDIDAWDEIDKEARNHDSPIDPEFL